MASQNGIQNNDNSVTVIKQDPWGTETWRYTGRILRRKEDALILEAFFNRPDSLFHGITLARGDRFIETYYTQRWYNIFEIYNHEGDTFKGWYINITYPAKIQDQVISFRDLALDLLIYPDGRQLVLDEDEFENLNLAKQDRDKALATLSELEEIYKEQPPSRYR